MRAFAVLAVGLLALLAALQGISQSIAASQRELTLLPLLLGLIPGVLLAGLLIRRARGSSLHAWQLAAVLFLALADVLFMLVTSAGL